MKNQEEIFEKLQEKFVAAGKKDEFIIVAGALQAGLNPEAVERYMVPNLDAEQLLEQMAGILDGLPSQTLNTYTSGKISASDMRQFRISSRGDAAVDMILQEVRTVNETLLDIDYHKEISDLVKMCKELKKELRDIKSHRAERAQDADKALDAANGDAKNPGDMSEIENITMLQKADEEAKKELHDNSAEPVAFINKNENLTIEYGRKAESGKTESGNILSFFRRINSDRIEKNEEKKKLSVMEFVNSGMDEDKLQAVLEAVRYGVPHDRLQYIIDKNGTANKIRQMTQIYLYLFGGLAEMATA